MKTNIILSMAHEKAARDNIGPQNTAEAGKGYIVAYHATDGEFDVFQPKSFGVDSDGNKLLHEWYYFAKDKKWSKKFSQQEGAFKQHGKKVKIKKYYLDLHNPLDITNITLTVEQWKLHLESKGVKLPDSYWLVKTQGEINEGLRPNQRKWGFWQMTRNDTGQMRQAILDSGYDGLVMSDVVRDDTENTTYVVFNKTQIM